VCAQTFDAIDVEKTLYQPAAKEARAAGDENSLITHFRPEFSRLREDVVEIDDRKRCCHA
jgi:hypothetical protein